MAATIIIATGNEAVSMSRFFSRCGGISSKDAVMRCSACFMTAGVSVSSCIVKSSCLMSFAAWGRKGYLARSSFVRDMRLFYFYAWG